MDKFTCGVAVGFVVAMLISSFFDEPNARKEIYQEAIDHGYMQYNPKTGEPEWVEQKETGE